MRTTTISLILFLLLSLTSCDRKSETATDTAEVTDNVQATDTSLEDVVAKHLAAIGGAEAHRQQTTRLMDGSITLMGTSGKLTVTQKAPDKKHSRMEMPGGLITTEACDGTIAWQKSSGQAARQLSGEELAGKVRDARFCAGIEMMTSEDLRYAKEETVKGQTYHVLQAGGPDSGGPYSLYINDRTHLLDVIKSPVVGMGEITIEMGDYRSVDGIQISFSLVVSMGSNVFMTVQFDTVTHGLEVEDVLFAKPAD